MKQINLLLIAVFALSFASCEDTFLAPELETGINARIITQLIPKFKQVFLIFMMEFKE